MSKQSNVVGSSDVQQSEYVKAKVQLRATSSCARCKLLRASALLLSLFKRETKAKFVFILQFFSIICQMNGIIVFREHKIIFVVIIVTTNTYRIS